MYNQCRYLRFGSETTSLVLLPADQQQCSFLRLSHRGTGHVLGSVSNADVIERVRQSFR